MKPREELYRVINGIKYVSNMLDIVEEELSGSDNKKITKTTAKKLLDDMIEDNILTDVEMQTIDYIFHHYLWEEGAWFWFKDELSKWKEEFEKPISITLKELSKCKFPQEDVWKTEIQKLERNRSIRSAANQTYTDHDKLTLVVHLANGQRVEVGSNYIEWSANYVELRGGFTIPHHAIERVKI